MSLGKVLRLNLALCCILGVSVWIYRDADTSHTRSRRAACTNCLKQIGLALHNYHAAHGSFPPAHIDDADGKPIHSWRVLLLPFLEEKALYDAYNFSEPWNSPANRRLIRRIPGVYVCPSGHDWVSPKGMTSYVTITGKGTAFPDGTSVARADLKDGDPATILAAELDNADIPWTEPRDLDLQSMSIHVNDLKRSGISSQHRRGANVLFADGAVRFMSDQITPQDLTALITIDGGEPIDVDSALSR